MLGEGVVAAGVYQQHGNAGIFEGFLHFHQGHAVAQEFGFTLALDVGGQQQLIGAYLHAVAGKVKDDFVAFVDAAFEGVDGLPELVAPHVDGLDDIETGLLEYAGHELGIIPGILEAFYVGVLVVADDQSQAGGLGGQYRAQHTQQRQTHP